MRKLDNWIDRGFKPILYAIILLMPLTVLAQKQFVAELIEQDDDNDYKGTYHCINSDVLTPIEKLMSQSNFCEISDDFMLIPNCASELFEDGTMPVYEIRINKLYHLFNGDVLDYYAWLKEDYNTPLKVKRFKETDDYKFQKSEMQQDVDCILGSTFYSIRSISSDENYDLNSNTFKIQLPNALNGYDLYLKREDSHFGKFDFKTTSIDEDTAYKIETNPCNIIVFVKFTGKTRVHGVSKQTICEPTNVIIADNNSGEIYYEYTPTKDITNSINEGKKAPQSSVSEPHEEKGAIFENGDSGVFKHISEKLKICKHCEKEGIRVKIIVHYEVLPDCSIKVLSLNQSTGCDIQDRYIKDVIESIKVVSPATVDGKPVKTTYRTPIKLYL